MGDSVIKDTEEEQLRQASLLEAVAAGRAKVCIKYNVIHVK